MTRTSLKRSIGAAAGALGIMAVTVVGFAGGALADGPRGHEHGFGRAPVHAPAQRFEHGRFEHGGVERHHRHGGSGAAVALGIGALFVGAMIAAEANRRHAED